MFEFLKKKKPVSPYDREKKIPVIRSSICTGEQVAGFKDRATGQFQEVMLIRSDADLQEYLRFYAVDKDDIQREW